MTKKATNGRGLTELEGAALAVIARVGACTPYAVKEGFRTSPSEFWSGSAGAVYPLIERLGRRGFLDVEADASDGRARKTVSLTRAGRSALADWLVDAERAAGLGFDPLRTRLYFSDLIPPARLRGFLRETAAAMVKTSAPDSDLAHIARVHDLWMRLRQAALAAFARRH